MTVRQDGCQMKEYDSTIWKLCITTTGYFKRDVRTTSSRVFADKNRYFKLERDLSLTPTKCFFLLNLTRPKAKCCHNIEY